MHPVTHRTIRSAFTGFNLGPGLPAGGQVSPDAVTPTGAKDMPTEMSGGGQIQTLPTGTDITFASNPRPGSNYNPFVTDSLRSQSVGTGMSFEGFSNNYTESSYASARSGSLEERLGYKAQQKFLNEKVNWRVVAWFVEAAWLAGLAPSAMPGYQKDPHRYHEMAGVRAPGWQWVDQRNAAQAAGMMVGLTIETRTNLAAERGLDFGDIIETLVEEEQALLVLNKVRAQNKKLQEDLDEPATTN